MTQGAGVPLGVVARGVAQKGGRGRGACPVVVVVVLLSCLKRLRCTVQYSTVRIIRTCSRVLFWETDVANRGFVDGGVVLRASRTFNGFIFFGLLRIPPTRRMA